MTIDYALIWAALIAFVVLAYIVLDGFDLGVGILFPWVKGQAHRDQMMNSVAPVWDLWWCVLICCGVCGVSVSLFNHYAGTVRPIYCHAVSSRI